MSLWMLWLACTVTDKDTESLGVPTHSDPATATDSEQPIEEICNGLDDDGDDRIDEGLETSTWYADSDGDGFGDDATVTDDCADLTGYVAVGGDCDDEDEDVSPAAIEVCNQIDDDCDSATSEAGTAWLEGTDGSWSELTDSLTAGSDGAPAVVGLQDPGVLHVCPGTFHVSLRVQADVELRGEGSGVVLSGGGEEGVVVVRNDGLAVGLTDLTLSDGAGSGAVLGEYTAGGGLECDASGVSLELTRVSITESAAGVGGGIYLRGCDATLDEVQLSNNEASYYGGGLALLGGVLDAVGLSVEGNSARFGGGLALVDYDGEVSATLSSSLVQANSASLQGGGVILEDAQLSCEGSTTTTDGVLANEASEGGGVYLASGSVSSVDCDWGSGATDNVPDDISSSEEAWDTDETFTCDTAGCVE